MTELPENKNYRITRGITYLFVFLAIWGVFVTRSYSNERYYAVAVVYVITVIVAGIITNENINIEIDETIVIPALMIATWVYGILMGVLRGNDPSLILRNFAGFTFYALAIVIMGVKPDYNIISKIFLFCANVLLVLTPIAFAMMFYAGRGPLLLSIPFLNSFSTGIQATGYALEYFGSILMFVGYGYCLYKMFTTKTVFSWRCIVAAMYAFDLIIISKSGGTTLALLAVSACIFVALFNKNNSRARAFIKLLVFSAVFAVFVIVGAKYIVNIFAQSDEGNSARYQQISFVLNNLSFFGHGLGAEYTELGKGYAIEAVYLDLVYKLGIVSLVPLMIYIYSFGKALMHLFKTEGNWQDVVPLALLGNLFISLGNPTLFSAGTVVEHILALGYMNEIKKGNC